MIFPYPIIYVEDGIILLYFTNEKIKVTTYDFTYHESIGRILCIFDNFYVVPIDFFEKNFLLNPGNKIYFMRYNFFEIEAVLCEEFVITQEFIINLKAYNKFWELQKNNNVVVAEKNN